VSPGPMGQDFSGNCAVTSRNPLIHNGATNSTKVPGFDTEGVTLFRCQVITAASDELLATSNFRELLFFSTHSGE
jgi:hypothetical protein